ncbi:interferon-induced protein 44-like [Sphaeramia orbicularis]|uniref:interferon-induced protein 44-like n=1 Tax=Sphaeramia orbicularis TaxID=375764 RepID=UPI00117D1406|nr:interferon-induced protein 44-like [Sphaeramia orbicularis]
MNWMFQKREVKPSSSPLLDKEWRPVPWNAKAEYLQFVRGFEPFQPHNDEKNEEQCIRILLHGPTGHGKSSFINSVDTILQGRMTGRALADTIVGNSFTKKYTTYKITKGAHGTFYPFVFNDTMGLEKDKGVLEEDIKLAMMGHVKDGYTFNPHSTLSTDDLYYNRNPSLNDKAHVLVCVVSAARVHLLSQELMTNMRNVRREASDLGIPQMAILTNIDVACPEVDANLRNVYKSKFVKRQMEVLSASLGIPLNCIFPVKNYHSEIAPNDDLEMLILMALKQMIHFGEDFVNDCKCT